MNKTMYFYNRKYPEHNIEEIIVNSEELLVWKDYKQISAVYTNYDISCYTKCDNEHYISLYQPYDEEDIYVHDNTFGNELIFSYNKEKINEWRKEDIELEIHNAVSVMNADDLYEVLCKELSFNKMIELYRLIQHKMHYLGDEPRMTIGYYQPTPYEPYEPKGSEVDE